MGRDGDGDDDGFARGQARRRWLARLVPLLLLAAPFLWYAGKLGQHEAHRRERAAADALGEGEAAALATALDAAEARVRGALDGWKERVTPERLASFGPGAGACAAGIKAPRMGADESYIKHGSIDGNYFGGWGYRFLEAGAAIEAPYAITSETDAIAEVRRKLAAGEAGRRDLEWAERVASGRAWASERVVLVRADERREPIFLAGVGGFDSFEGGLVRGRAYAIDVGAQEVVCVGDFEATNSPVIDFSYLSTSPMDEGAKRAAGEATLTRDFEVAIRRAIAGGLAAATAAN